MTKKKKEVKKNKQIKTAIEHIISTINDISREVAECPKSDTELWGCNSCADFSDHFKFLCETVACLGGIINNILVSNPEMEIADMREEPNDIKNILKDLDKNIPEGMYQ